MAGINGIAHIQLSVADMGRSVPFYEKLSHSMEMVTRVNSPQLFYCIGARTGVAISPIATEYADQPFVSGVPEGKSYPAPLVCSGIFHSMFST